MGARKRILIVCPAPRDERELKRLASAHDYEFIFDDFTSDYLEQLIYEEGHGHESSPDILEVINRLIMRYRYEHLDGVLSSDDYPGATLACILAHELKLPAPHPAVSLLCQHKYLSRRAQRAVVPHAVPDCILIDPHNSAVLPDNLVLPKIPFFIKPVKSYFSCYAQAIHTAEQWQQYLMNTKIPVTFLEPFNLMLKHYSHHHLSADYFIAETLLSGNQVTVEGFVYDGSAQIIGITDSLMFPGTISFRRFVYPSSLPADVQERMSDIARRCMEGIGFNNGIFNIEMMYDPVGDVISIIEINPRMSSQFADLYEKVDGINTYEIALALATGTQPSLRSRRGVYRCAASCVLRLFENKVVHRVPEQHDIERLYQKFPEVRVEIFVGRGARLSTTLQDGKSYRYGLINLGANNHQALEEQFERAIALLPFEFLDVR